MSRLVRQVPTQRFQVPLRWRQWPTRLIRYRPERQRRAAERERDFFATSQPVCLAADRSTGRHAPVAGETSRPYLCAPHQRVQFQNSIIAPPSTQPIARAPVLARQSNASDSRVKLGMTATSRPRRCDASSSAAACASSGAFSAAGQRAAFRAGWLRACARRLACLNLLLLLCIVAQKADSGLGATTTTTTTMAAEAQLG